jgi:hypothetical protein
MPGFDTLVDDAETRAVDDLYFLIAIVRRDRNESGDHDFTGSCTSISAWRQVPEIAPKKASGRKSELSDITLRLSKVIAHRLAGVFGSPGSRGRFGFTSAGTTDHRVGRTEGGRGPGPLAG